MLTQLITAPTLEPVTLVEAKKQLQLEHALDDTFVGTLITAARKYVEEICWRGLVTQTWEVVARDFSADKGEGIELPKGNLVAIASVKYVDGAGVEQTLVATTDYVPDAVSVPGRVRLAYSKSWPDARDQWDAVKIRYSVGWAPASVPGPLKQAILLLVSQMYEHRTPEITGTIVSSVGFAADSLLRPYRLVRFT